MSESYMKTDLIRELAAAARISRRRAEIVLETLRQIAYREARQGFAVPGICRLDVVHRRSRQVRNPQNGQILEIAEHDALRVRPLKRAKNAIAPAPRAMVKLLEETAPAEVAPAATVEAATVAAASTPPAAPAADQQSPAAPAADQQSPTAPAANMPAPAPAAAQDEDGQFVSFRCKNCGQEIEASLEMVGGPNECPTCGEELIVPYTSEPGTIWFQNPTTSPETLPPSAATVQSMKGRTIRIELPDDV